MSTSSRYPITLYGDQEHEGIRLVVLLVLFVALWPGYFILNAALRTLFPGLGPVTALSCVGAIPLSLLAAGGSEYLLKRLWPSGRRLLITERRLCLREREQPDQEIRTDENVNALWWYFSLAGYARAGRERRVSGKWFCLAGQLRQDEERLIIYCYAPPQQKEVWLEQYDFHRLVPGDVYETSFQARWRVLYRPEIPAEILAGPDGPYWLAERRRWESGIELTWQDFDTFLQAIPHYGEGEL